MMKLISRLLIALVATTLISCYPSMYNAPVTYGSDDMYNTHSRSQIDQKENAIAITEQEVKKRRMAEWADIMGFDALANAEEYHDKIYNTHYGEKIKALHASYYQYPQSYYQLKYQDDALEVLSAYDPALFNATIDSDGRVSVSPKYISSMYGAWDVPYYYNDFWVYGYPTYSWYDPFPYGFGYGYPIGYAGAFSFGVGFGVGFGYGFGYPGFYYPYAYPGLYPGFYYPYGPMPYYGGMPRSIVPHGTALGGYYSTGARQRSGATVGTSTSNRYNRGGASYSTSAPQIRTSTPTRMPSFRGSGGAVPTNRFGR